MMRFRYLCKSSAYFAIDKESHSIYTVLETCNVRIPVPTSFVLRAISYQLGRTIGFRTIQVSPLCVRPGYTMHIIYWSSDGLA